MRTPSRIAACNPPLRQRKQTTLKRCEQRRSPAGGLLEVLLKLSPGRPTGWVLQPKLLPGHSGRVLQVFHLGEPNPVRRLRCTTAEAPLLLLSPQLSGEGTIRSISHHNGGHQEQAMSSLNRCRRPLLLGSTRWTGCAS